MTITCSKKKLYWGKKLLRRKTSVRLHIIAEIRNKMNSVCRLCQGRLLAVVTSSGI